MKIWHMVPLCRFRFLAEAGTQFITRRQSASRGRLKRTTVGFDGLYIQVPFAIPVGPHPKPTLSCPPVALRAERLLVTEIDAQLEAPYGPVEPRIPSTPQMTGICVDITRLPLCHV
jgi:hypothetical protein